MSEKFESGFFTSNWTKSDEDHEKDANLNFQRVSFAESNLLSEYQPEAMASFILSNFESESAQEFISDVMMNGYGLISIAIERIFDPENYPGLIECEEALIAAEFVAKAVGHPAFDFPEDAAEWYHTNLPEGSQENHEVAALNEKAADAIDRIVTESELRDLWEEQPTFNDWFEAQVELQKRILG